LKRAYLALFNNIKKKDYGKQWKSVTKSKFPKNKLPKDTVIYDNSFSNQPTIFQQMYTFLIDLKMKFDTVY
jgi:hypothetical protein